MKVGDLVIQSNRVLKIRHTEDPKRMRSVGTIIAVHTPVRAGDGDGGGYSQWTKWLGGILVDVVWSCGKVSQNFAANSLEVISESR